ncbi:ligase-associated DNA damage response endonuclease PdeM [Lichenibacterium ramalinae]|uniref:Ligase-associated DNA damage response endonuclease PdeM n=1 Tax=Lichenibacterium ramalinae TaxID=2316527 RepID=A0A4Q2RC33_9HYPH|nr:ligase-associated DNA damage response endonuclease PdeM [Lichenibacterium ramalinae]
MTALKRKAPVEARPGVVSRVHSHVGVAGVDLLADVCGALFHEADGVLLVADLHLEKGSSFARRGLMLPPYDTAATLAKLGAVVARTRPRLVVALGDSFHDRAGASRMGEADRAALAALQAGRDWVWLAGNHDPAPPKGLGGTTAATWSLGPLTLRHEPLPGAPAGEIAGHLHPVAIVAGAGGAVRRRAFVSDGTRCIMPAFGAYAGGLNFRHPAFAGLLKEGRRIAHALGRDRVYAIPESRCLAGA